MITDDELRREALRLHGRYSEEIVEAFDICPWARHARQAGEWHRDVLLQREAEVGPTLEALGRLEADPRRIAVAILIYPRLALEPRAFDEFAQRVRQADQDRHAGRPVYVAATFHPDYRHDDRSPAALVPYLRRSPDPSLQLIRLAVIEEARGAHGKFLFDFTPEGWAEVMRRQQQPSVTDRIAQDNFARLAREGRERVEQVYRDILADRDRSYR